MGAQIGPWGAPGEVHTEGLQGRRRPALRPWAVDCEEVWVRILPPPTKDLCESERSHHDQTHWWSRRPIRATPGSLALDGGREEGPGGRKAGHERHLLSRLVVQRPALKTEAADRLPESGERTPQMSNPQSGSREAAWDRGDTPVRSSLVSDSRVHGVCGGWHQRCALGMGGGQGSPRGR